MHARHRKQIECALTAPGGALRHQQRVGGDLVNGGREECARKEKARGASDEARTQALWASARGHEAKHSRHQQVDSHEETSSVQDHLGSILIEVKTVHVSEVAHEKLHALCYNECARHHQHHEGVEHEVVQVDVVFDVIVVEGHCY